MELQELIEKREIGANDDVKQRAKRLTEELHWVKEDAMNIWWFGPDNEGSNILISSKKGVQRMTEANDSINSAFQPATKRSTD